ncbi:hypothetical protein BGZ65_000560, partial [Modicella reniformis]
PIITPLNHHGQPQTVCLVEGESTSRAFEIEVPEATTTVSNLRDEIKIKKSPEFDDIDAYKLNLWKVSVPVTDDNEGQPAQLDTLHAEKLSRPTRKLSSVFSREDLPEDTIHIVVRRP